jgi:hypothetical protein
MTPPRSNGPTRPTPDAAPDRPAVDDPATRRLNANIPGAMLDEMVEEKRRSGRDITELVKLGWKLTKIALREQRQGNVLAVVDADGRILKELVIPD